MKSNCPLCGDKSLKKNKDYLNHFFLCPTCKGIFREPNQFLNAVEEKKRYLHHRNDMEDTGYYKFVLPIIDQVKLHFPEGGFGLDFGCGHTPVLSNYLERSGYKVSVYDPIFHNDKSVLDQSYDFIVCCEVIEHFFHPSEEFRKLFNILKPQGKLICKTHLFEKGIDFDTWYYKNDPSHVFIYQNDTMNWIKNNYQIRGVKIDDRVITFTK